MITEIISAEVPTTTEGGNIVLEGINLETILTADDLFEATEAETVRFVFPKDSIPARKYLFKICQSQKALKNKGSFGEMIQSLPGCILSISESFIEK